MTRGTQYRSFVVQGVKRVTALRIRLRGIRRRLVRSMIIGMSRLCVQRFAEGMGVFG
jgi:hypothetical protein